MTDRAQFRSFGPIMPFRSMRMGEQIERFRDAKHFNTLAAANGSRACAR